MKNNLLENPNALAVASLMLTDNINEKELEKGNLNVIQAESGENGLTAPAKAHAERIITRLQKEITELNNIKSKLNFVINGGKIENEH